MPNPINFSVAAAQRSGSFQTSVLAYPGGFSSISWQLVGMGTGAGSDYENIANSCTTTMYYTTDGSTPTTQSGIFDQTSWQGGQAIGKPVTSITAASDGQALPQSIVNVVDTSKFPSSGQFAVIIGGQYVLVSYTGTTPTSFTGCSGGSGTLSASTGNNVGPVDPVPTEFMGLANLPAGAKVLIVIALGGTFTIGIGNGVIQ